MEISFFSSLRGKLVLFALLSGLILIAVGLEGLSGLNQLNTFADTKIVETQKHVDALLDMEKAMHTYKNQVQSFKNVLIRGNDREKFEKHSAEFGKFNVEVDKQLSETAAAAKLANMPDEVQKAIDLAMQEHKRMGENYSEAIKQIVIEDPNTGKSVDKLVEGKDKATTKAMLAIEEATTKELQSKLVELKTQVQGTYAQTQHFVLWSLIVGLLVVVGLSTYLIKRITSPLLELERVAHHLAKGEFGVEINIDTKDEIGDVADALRTMLKQLIDAIDHVHKNVAELLNASDQISASAHSLSQVTTEQAANVEQTTSSVEQLNASVQQNSQNAHTTDQMAAQSSDQAAKSGVAMNETLQAMKDIANKITQIEDIAYKTNLLSLNAAIEAASAGEHGKGFAVVAAEVRKLAESSRLTAEQVNELATSSVRIAENAGHLISQVIPNIAKTADLIQEISATSVEQSSGIRQISNAMHQLEKVTQQNASSSEQLAATAEGLHSQAIELEQAMAFFKIDRQD